MKEVWIIIAVNQSQTYCYILLMSRIIGTRYGSIDQSWSSKKQESIIAEIVDGTLTSRI